MKLKIKKVSNKKISNQFVLLVGDDGAILCHFLENKLSNRIFVDSPLSEDVKLFEKLLSTYPKHPLTILVDVIEQTYTQQVLPPVSSMGLVTQVQRRIKRDFRPEDLNNYIVAGKQKEGRKDWNVVFISLANSDPFAKWLEFALKQQNRFDGIYLLPIESTKFNDALKASMPKAEPATWEIVLLHNKTGGFRIVTFKDGKIIFARLAQNIIGDNIPEVVVGNLEQEIQNTFEYLKRLGFNSETGSRLTIISSAEILEKVDTKTLKFGQVNLLSPHQASEILGLPSAVAEKDKYADVLCATFFATAKKRTLKFDTANTKKLGNIYLGRKALLFAFLFFLIGGGLYEIKRLYGVIQTGKEIEQLQSEIKQRNVLLVKAQEKMKGKSEADIDKIVAIYNLYNSLPVHKYQLLKTLSKISSEFGKDYVVSSIKYEVKDFKALNPVEQNGKLNMERFLSQLKQEDGKFELVLTIDFLLTETKAQRLEEISTELLEKIKKLLPDAQIEYLKKPELPKVESFEEISSAAIDEAQQHIVVKGDIKIIINKVGE